jgi:hypothetical protein
MKTTDLLALATAAALVAPPGCGAGPARHDASGLQGLEDVERAYWAAWTPAPEAPALGDLGAHLVFDHWTLDGEGTELVWSALFPILDSARLAGPAEAAPALELALHVLEPDDAPGGRVASDVSFVVSGRGAAPEWEGVLVRIWRELPSGASPGVGVLLTRHARGELESPSVATVWVSPGFSEVAPATVTLRGDVTVSAGLGGASPVDDPLEPLYPAEPEPLAASLFEALTPAMWDTLTRERYVDPALGLLESPPEPSPRFAAPKVASRDIDQVFSQTAFLPKIRSGKFKF